MDLIELLPYITVAIVGWILGVLVNYLADFLPSKRRLILPTCRECESHQPYLNYFIWPRRCPVCGYKRDYRTWWVEIIFIGISLWLWIAQPSGINYFLGLVLCTYFGVVIIIDIEHRLILHPVSIVGGVLGLAIGVWLHGLRITIFGGLAGFVIMFLLHYFGTIFMGWASKRRGHELEEEALGFGDVNLGGVIGLILGWPGVVMGLILAILLAGVFSLLYLLLSYSPGNTDRI
jgi:leader peptidase (prepilin peptidase)/N-methyltransferase